MSNLPCVVPLLSQTKLHLIPGSWVIVETKREGILEGQVHENPTVTTFDIQTVFSIQLINTRNIESGEMIPGLLILYENEIHKITLKGSEELSKEQTCKMKQRKRTGGISMDTVVITTFEQLNNLYKQLITFDIKEVGCHLEFKSDEKVIEWVIFNIRNTIVPIDIMKLCINLKDEDYLWTSLGHHIFSNINIQKIFFNCEEFVKYLYHKYKIKLQNVFDITVADSFITNIIQKEKDTSYQSPLVVSSTIGKPQIISPCSIKNIMNFSTILSKYLDYMIHPSEMQFLNSMSKTNVDEDGNDNVDTTDYVSDGDSEEELVMYRLDLLCSKSDDISRLKILEHLEEKKSKIREQVITERKGRYRKYLAIKVKYLIFLKQVLEKKMLENLDSLIFHQMDFIIKSNNAIALGFLSSPKTIGEYFKTFLENIKM